MSVTKYEIRGAAFDTCQGVDCGLPARYGNPITNEWYCDKRGCGTESVRRREQDKINAQLAHVQRDLWSLSLREGIIPDGFDASLELAEKMSKDPNWRGSRLMEHFMMCALELRTRLTDDESS